jgi:septal ring factor EnvC (AmiA/AmiB activator)
MDTVSPAQIGAFIACLIVLLGLALTIKNLFQRTPPLHQEFVAKAQYEKDQASVQEEFRRQAVSRKSLYERVEQLGHEQAAIKAETQAQTRSLHALDTKIDNLPERILRLVDRKAGS